MRKEILKYGLSKYGTYWPRNVLKNSIGLFEGAAIFGSNGYINCLRNARYKKGIVYADVPDEIAEKELHIDCIAKIKDENGKRIVIGIEKLLGFLFDEELWLTEEGLKVLAARRV